MKKIDLKRVIQERELDTNELAKHLFPGNTHARLALNRVMRGESLLNADQISKLALFCGLSIEELFSGGAWTNKKDKGIHTFTNGDFKAELNLGEGMTKLYHKGSLFHESILHESMIPLNEYIKKIEVEILKFLKNDGN